MSSIGDLFFRLIADDGEFQGQVTKSAEKAGKSGSSALAKTLKFPSAKDILGDIATGAGIGGGIALFNELGQAIRNVADFIPNLIAKGQAYGLAVHEISERTGATAEASSALAADLTFLGVPMDNVGQKLSMMAKQIYTNEKNFENLGIAVKDANGNWLDGVTILDNIRARYQSLPDDIQKAAIAQQLVGRGGGDFLEYLNLTDQQISQLHDEWARLGLIMDEAGVQRAKDVEREQALLGVALTGLGNRLFQDVAPAVAALTDAFVRLVEEKGPEIEAFFARAAGFVMGLVQGLFGVDMSASDTFISNLNLSADAASNLGDQTQTAANAASDAASAASAHAAAVKAATDALNAESSALDRQSTALKATADAEETLFQRKLKNLSADVAAQIAALDAAQKEQETARQRTQNAEALAKAQLDLASAQAKVREDTLKGDNTDADVAAVARASQTVQDAKQAQVDFEAQLQNDARKAQLQATQQYVEDVARIESSNDNKGAVANTMAARAKALNSEIAAAQEKGDAQSVADLKIRLEAVTAAEARAKSGERIAIAQNEITAKKAAIAAEIKALQDTAAATTALGDTTQTETQQALAGWEAQRTAVFGDGSSTGASGGLIGSLKEASIEGQKAAEQLKTAFGGLADLFTGMAGAVGTVSGALPAVVKWAQDNLPLIGASALALGAATGNVPLALAGLAMWELGSSGKPQPVEYGNLSGNQQEQLNQAGAPPALWNQPGKGTAGAQELIDYLRKIPDVPYNINQWGDFGGVLRKGMTSKQAVDALVKAGYGHAAGGFMPAGLPAVLGERGMLEPVITFPQLPSFAFPSVPQLAGALAGASAGAGDGSPAIVRIEIGGNPLLDYIDRGLRYRRR
jgi:hypothetical protein